MRNNNKDLDKEKKVAKNLEELLLNTEERDEKREELIKAGSDIPDLKPTEHMNFSNIQEEANKEAKRVIQSVIEFYVEKDVIKEKAYIKDKQRVDELTLSSVLFQLKTAQYAIIKALEEIDLGNTHPRIFESLASLQNQMMNIVKHQASLTIALQESYKSINIDSQTISPKQLKEATEDGTLILTGGLDKEGKKVTGVKTRGTRNLIKNMRNIEDTEYEEIEEDEPRLTDAKRRPETPEYAKEKKSSEDDNYFEIEDEQFE